MQTQDSANMTLILSGMFVFYAWVAWLIVEWRKLRHKSLLQTKLMDKFSGSRELLDFLQTDGGHQFLDFLKLGGIAPRERILSSISRAAILAVLGVAVFLLSFIFEDQSKIYLAVAIMVEALAGGLLASALVSNRLGRKWGLFDK